MLQYVEKGRQKVLEANENGEASLQELWDEATEYQDEYFNAVADDGFYNAFFSHLKKDPREFLMQNGYAKGFRQLDYSP